MQNFEVATREFLGRKAIIQVSDEFELAKNLENLFASDAARKELGRRARETFETNLHAARRTARVILDSLEVETAAPVASLPRGSRRSRRPINGGISRRRSNLLGRGCCLFFSFGI
jgi:hypothetical protein